MLFWIVFLASIRIICACPSSCLCRWKGGKQTVECIDKGLITIPNGIDQGTQVLDFSGNNLNELPRERFKRMGIINLQKVYLPRCKISQIDDRAFSGLTNLVELDLSENLISTVPTVTFLDFKSLMRLSLSRNPIRRLRSGSFKPLGFLTSLELSHCQIETIDDESFTGLDKLEWLKLDSNRLQNIKGSNILPDRLNEIDLQNNPFVCDCKMIDLRNWLTKYNTKRIPQSGEPKCIGPSRVRGYSITTLEVHDLACLPDVTPTTLYLEITEGKNVSLLCRVSAVPEAKVTWWFQGNILQNDSIVSPGVHLYYYIEEGTVEKRSELFIYNTNVEDNGTFLCVAENPAGRSQSNYSIRIILKEEPLEGLAVFPYEYVILISAGVSVVALLLVMFITLCIVRCRRQRRRKRKKNRCKAVVLVDQQTFAKGPNTQDHITRIGITQSEPKVNGSVEREQMYSTGTTVLVVPNNLQLQKYESQISLRNYSDPNPDLLNDMESGKERRQMPLDVYDKIGAMNYQDAMNNVLNELENKQVSQQWPVQVGNVPGGHEYQGECQSSPRKYIDKDGYPVDYGLPKVPHFFPTMVPSTGFYRTLPHKSRQNAANPSSRYSREAEFLSKSIQPASYEHFNPADVRYTVEGYPRQPLFSSDPVVSFLVPSPPVPYKTPKDASAQWPETIPDSDPLGLSQCSVAAQTNDMCKSSFASNPLHHLPPVLTESPDEGYEGETTDATEI